MLIRLINMLKQDPENDGDAVSKSYVNTVIQKNQLKPSHNTNQFAYLVQNILEWTDLTSGGNSFNMTKIGDLSPDKDNFHSYNHKVIYTTMIKNSQGKRGGGEGGTSIKWEFSVFL